MAEPVLKPQLPKKKNGICVERIALYCTSVYVYTVYDN